MVRLSRIETTLTDSIHYRRCALRRLRWLVLFLVWVMAPWALAGDGFGYSGWGPRLGLSVDPDQAFGGIHIDLGEFAPNVRFQPNAELGIGDDQVLLALNLEVSYLFPVSESWMPYVGGGLGINYVNFDEPRGRSGDDDDTDLGFNVLGGIQRVRTNASDMFLELKIGLSDSPDAKILFGWTFGNPTHSARAGSQRNP
jgi:opacity protein-like surface antigen